MRKPDQAQHLVERCFRNELGILVVALSFGLAVPLVAGAAAVSACITYAHHAFLIGKLAARFPDLELVSGEGGRGQGRPKRCDGGN